MSDHEPTTERVTPPSWAEPETVVLGQLETLGPVVAPGAQLYGDLLELERVSQVRTLRDARRAAGDSGRVASWLNAYEEDLEFDDEVPDPDADISETLGEYFIETMRLPWVHDGGKGPLLDAVVAETATVEGASPGGNVDHIRFEISVEELAAKLREGAYVRSYFRLTSSRSSWAFR